MKMRRCEDEKMRDRPPLLEEPCAQTLSGKNGVHLDPLAHHQFSKKWNFGGVANFKTHRYMTSHVRWLNGDRVTPCELNFPWHTLHVGYIPAE